MENMRLWCDRAERDHLAARTRLSRKGTPPSVSEAILSALIAEGYLNEERFAKAFASDHYRLRRWGIVKIEHALRSRGISEPNIRAALGELPEDRSGIASQLAAQYLPKVLRHPEGERKYRLARHLMSRGYTRDEAFDAAIRTLQGRQSGGDL